MLLAPYNLISLQLQSFLYWTQNICDPGLRHIKNGREDVEGKGRCKTPHEVNKTWIYLAISISVRGMKIELFRNITCCVGKQSIYREIGGRKTGEF